MSTIREQLHTTFMGLAGLLTKMNVLQGSDSTVSMTTLDAKIDDASTLLDESVAAQLYAIIGEEEEEQS